MNVEAIFISPVKSLHLQKVESAMVGKTGLIGDREFFLVDESNNLVTMREVGALAAVQADYAFEHELLRFQFPDGRAIESKPIIGEPFDARFFGTHDVAAYELGGPWNDALSLYAGRPLRLAKAGEKRSGVDAFPVSLLSQASIARLRDTSKEHAIEARRFRPNILVSGAERPHQEDEWIGSYLRIGHAVIHVRMRDARCVVTTLNPDSGAPDVNTLKLISAYRTDQPNEVNFGVYGTVAEEGEIAVGDKIEVIETEQE